MSICFSNCGIRTEVCGFDENVLRAFQKLLDIADGLLFQFVLLRTFNM